MNDRPRVSGRVPRPSALLQGEPSLGDVSAQLTALSVTTGQLASGMGFLEQRLQGTEQRLGGRIDGLQASVSGLATDVQFLRTTQVGDHAPRLLAVEQRTLAQRAGGIAATGLKLGSYATLAGVVLRGLGKAYPQFGEAIDGVLKAFDL